MDNSFLQKKERAHKTYVAQKSIRNPYLDCDVVLNSDGFHHLRYSDRRERNKKEQILKFNLLPLALVIIKKAATLQEYRVMLIAEGKKSEGDGLRRTKRVEFWGFVAIISNDPQIKIRVVLKRIGDGNVIFWSVMPYSKLKKDIPQKLYTDSIEDE